MSERMKRAQTTIGAALLILALTAGFTVIGADLARDAIDPSRVDRETLLSAIGFGLTAEEHQNLTAITAIVILTLCAITAIQGIGVLARREGVRTAAIGTFVVFAIITVPLSLSGLASDEERSDGAWVGLVIGGACALIVYLLLHRQTVGDFERVEGARSRARSVKTGERLVRREARPSRPRRP
jgi:membrane protease YdiL (CAAX protease family)